MLLRKKGEVLLACCLLAFILAGCGSSQQKFPEVKAKPASAPEPKQPTTNAEAVKPYVFGQTLTFSDVLVEPYLVKGWSGRESWGRWTDGPIAELRLPLEKFSTDGNFTLTLQCGLLQPDKQQVVVSLNGTRIGEIGPGFKGPQVEIPFQSKLLRQQNLIVFDIEDPISPKELGTSPDARKLGLSAVSAKIGKD